VPYVAAPGGKKKLSKRNPPPGVMVALEEYENAGYLPEAILNALARLGWSLDDKSEIMPLETVIANFSLDRITSAPAGLDPDKMYWMQDHYMRQLSPEERVKRMLPFLQREELVADPPSDSELALLDRIDAACGDRLKLCADVVRYGGFFFRDRLDYDDKSLKTLNKEGVPELLEQIHATLENIEPYVATNIEEAIKRLADQTGIGGKINHVLRAAVTGQSVGPGVYECLEILGKQKSLDRIAATRATVTSNLA
jgi:glutamyl-tRNA synthetase